MGEWETLMRRKSCQEILLSWVENIKAALCRR